MNTIVLLSDFGTRDGFVGVVKGVMLSINPSLSFIDLTHEIEPFNIFEGALVLKAHYRYFPKNTIFWCVVDPGVGSERRPIIVKGETYIFVGPENGIFDFVIRDLKEAFTVYKIENEKYMLERINNTFHGRDIFAPVCAYLSLGVPPEEFGPEIEYKFSLPLKRAVKEADHIVGEIIYFDRYGNGITNIPCGSYSFAELKGKKLSVVPYFSAGINGMLNVTCGSFGFMEVFTPRGNAKEQFNLKVGDEIKIYF